MMTVIKVVFLFNGFFLFLSKIDLFVWFLVDVVYRMYGRDCITSVISEDIWFIVGCLWRFLQLKAGCFFFFHSFFQISNFLSQFLSVWNGVFFCLISEKIEENYVFFYQIMRIISLSTKNFSGIFTKEMDGDFHIFLLLGLRGWILNWVSCVFRWIWS